MLTFLRGYSKDDAASTPLREPVVAIGNFDGVHLGHRELVRRARTLADARGGHSVVLTFHPHPAKVLAPALAPPLISSLDRKLELLAGLGVDATVVQPFDAALAGQDAATFVAGTLVSGLRLRDVVVGYDFTYGRKRGGNVETLRAEGARSGFGVHVVAPVTVDGLVASSTKIRQFVLEGNVAGARLLLGREPDVDGVVVRGAGRGTTIGIPTANVATEAELLPASGVYAVHAVRLDDPTRVTLTGVANLGTNPTFTGPSGSALSLEVHLFDFSGDLYGQRLRVGFHSRLRGEERFPSAAALVAQIHKDMEEARRRLTA
jgi:riboflavin kinase / FMN adenylyltransferase